MEREIKLEIEELEERIAPAVLVAVKPAGGIEFCAPDQAGGGITGAESITTNIFEVKVEECNLVEGPS